MEKLGITETALMSEVVETLSGHVEENIEDRDYYLDLFCDALKKYQQGTS